MGVQSVKIPVQLEIQQLQGSINYIKRALDKLDPGTNLYKSLEKGLNKVIQQMNALEVESKQSFGSVKEIENFEKNFNKVGTSVQELGNLLNKVSFSDLGKIFSKDDLQPIEDARNEIDKLQKNISKIKTDKMFELTRSSKDFGDIITNLGVNTFDKAVSGIEQRVKELTKSIDSAEASLSGLQNTFLTNKDLSEKYNKVSSFDEIKKNFLNSYQKDGKQLLRFKAGGREQLTNILQGMGFDDATLEQVKKVSIDKLEELFQSLEKEIKKKVDSQNKSLERAQGNYEKAFAEQETRTNLRADYNIALDQLRDIEIDPTLQSTIDSLNDKIEEQEQKIIDLQKQLLITSGIQQDGIKAQQQATDTIEEGTKAIRAQADAAQEQAKAQELLSDIKFAIKNWFGFNEVINLTKNAVRNMITQIRELDDVMTQIAIVTDMTQKELWDQMGTYSAMAQQYGASIKGVYEVSQLYYQQGLQTAEVMNLTEETLKMAKIANLDYAEATDYMTVALRGFKLEMSDAQQVTDVYSALAAATASDTEELAVAMSKTASSAEAVGSSFESTSAMIATMISITREAPENIGSALKSIISRYGEMTSDPMKLVDSEGEEMSLNKVDKALQSVGISLQNAQGQFRDFDDVILELSKTWDTIDTNTQRYIATVMAGNRQQSRFLALVGNYEEYAKALEVAENAEDAGTLQTLKTMDSISTKWEQLKVSLQEFYTSAGLEDVFKGVLDALNAFLTKANDIPKLFGKIPVSVIALVSSLITSIKNVATSLTTAAIGPIKEFNKKLDELAKKNIEIKVKAVPETGSGTQARQVLENEAKQGGPITTNKNKTNILDKYNKEELQAIQNFLKTDRTNDDLSNLMLNLRDTSDETINYVNSLQELSKSQTYGALFDIDRAMENLAKSAKKSSNQVSIFNKSWKAIGDFGAKNAGSISLVTSALSALALTLKDSSSAGVEWSKTLSGGLNSVVGAVLGFASGQWQYAIPMLISGIPTLIDGIIYTTEEKLKNATEKATELSNISLQKKSDYKNLKNETKELENLTEARHDSAEAYQEWLDYNNQMASSYPELISYIDSEGNAIIDLAASYETLETARLAAAKASTEAVGATIEQAEISAQNAQEKVNKAIDFNYAPESTTADENIINTRDYFLNNSNKLYSAVMSSGQADLLYDAENIQTDIANYLNNPQNETYLASLLGEQSESEMLQNLATVLDTNIENISGENFEQKLTSILSERFEEFKEIQNAADLLLTDNTAYNNYKAEFNKLKQDSSTEAKENFLKYIGENYTELVKVQNELYSQNTDVATDAANQIQTYLDAYKEYSAALTQQALTNKQLEASYRQGIATFAYYDNELSTAEIGEELNNFNKLVTDFMVRRWKQSGKDIDTYLQSQESLDYQEFESAFEEIWQFLSSSQQTALNELLVSGEDYDFGDYKEALADFGITQGVIYDELTTQWYEEYSQAYGNFINAIESRNKKDNYIEKGISNLYSIAPKYYDEILDFYDKINLQISDGLISQLQGSDILDAYSSLWQQSKGLENEAEIQKILAEGDFTSLDGIYSLKESLKKAGFDANTILENLANSINVNVLTEWETFGQKVKTGLESFTEALTNATEGMDYEEAINMASKLEMSLSDFRFEDGEYFLDDIEAIQKVYGNFGEELKNKLIEQTDKELNTLLMQRESAYKMGDYKTAADLSSQMAEIQTAQENAESSVNEYIAYHTNLAYLTAGLYDGFIQQIGGNGSVAEMLAAGRESDTKLREYLLALGNENITEETVDGYVAAITDRISSVNDSILSLILDKNVGKGGSADISHLVEKTDLEGFTKITAEEIPELFAKMFGENYEAYNDAMLQYMEDSSADISGMIANLAGNIEHIDYSSVFEIANALGKNVNEIIGLFTDNLDGTFSTSLSNIQTLAQIAGTGITSEIQDAIREYLDNILGIVSNGISGSMTNVEFETLSNFMGLDLDFTETSEGLKLTKASAIEVYTELKKIDSIQAQITFSDLAESLEEAGSGYEDVASTMKTIAKLNRELADVPVSSERRAELERELAVAEEILHVRSQDPDSFNFMDKELPTGMQGPENYWNSVGQAYKVMNESASSGYMEIQDYVNIITHMSQMVEAAGGEFSIKGYNAAQLIEMGMSALSNVDGEGVKVNLENLGIDILGGTEGMTEGFADAIKEMARGQIEMLDAAIQMLETIVAMEEIGNIDTEGNGIDLGDILDFSVEGEVNYQEEYDTIRQSLLKNEELKETLDSFFIDGKSLTEWLSLSAEEFNALSDEAKQSFIKALEAFSNLSEGDYDINDVMGSLQDMIDQFGLEGTIILPIDKNGIQVIAEAGSPEVIKIEWNSEEVKNIIEKNNQYSLETIQEMVKKWALGDTKGFTSLDYTMIYQIIGKVTVDKDGNYTFMGQKFGPGEEEKLGQAIIDSEKIKSELPEGQDFKLETDNKGNITYTTTYGVNNKVELTVDENGDVTYTFGEYSGKSIEEVIDKYWADNEQKLLSYGVTKEQFVATFKGTVGIEAQPKLLTPETLKGSDGITQEIIDEYGIDTSQVNTIAAAFATVDWSPIGEKIAEGISKALTTVGEDTDAETGIPIDELTLKPTGLKVDTSAAGEPTLLNGEEGLTAIPVNSVTLKPTNVDIDTSESSLSESATSGLTISIPENLNADSVNLINQFNSAISAAAANAIVNSGITVAITGLDEAGISNIEDYSKAVEGIPEKEITSSVVGDISIDVFDLFKITQLKSAVEALKANPNVTPTIKAQAEGNALDVVSDIMALYGYDGKTAQLFFNALDPEGTLTTVYDQVNQITASDDANLIYTAELIKDEIEKQLAELTKDRKINITPTLVNPGEMEDPAYYIGDGTGKAYNTTTYSTYQGAQERLEQLKVEKGELAGDFTVELIDLATSQIDATTLTVTPLDSMNLTATNVTLTVNGGNGNNNNNNNNGSNGGQGEGGGGELPILDVSAITSAIQAIGDASNTAAENINEAVTTLTSIDTSPITTASSRVWSLISAMNSIKSSPASRVWGLVSAINAIPSSKTISIGYTVSVNVTGTGVAAGRITHSNADSWGGNSASGTLAKGNVALAKGTGNALASGSRKTLMGELGPELVVSNGRYFVVGQSGAEFVDLADDAIVFNHLQTKKLLGSGSAGHGKPITNEKNAVSFATGNVEGPAMASPSAVLAQLRQIRAMWQSLLGATSKDLGQLAGAGGGKGGGGSSDKDLKAVTAELERWYNLLRQIEKLEQNITYEQAKRANMINGFDQAKSLEEELYMLEKQKLAYSELSKLQEDYYKKRLAEFQNTAYAKIFTYDESGLMQYADGVNMGLDVLAKLNQSDEYGQLVPDMDTAKEQYKYLQSIGFEVEKLAYDEEGNKLKEGDKGFYQAVMENFWEQLESYKDELDGLYDSYHDATISLEETISAQNEILQEITDNQLEVEEKLYQAMVDLREAEIQAVEDEKEMLEKASEEYLEGLNNALAKEQEMYNRNQNKEETTNLQRRLAILQRSGGSASEIRSLQEQIDSRLKDEYFQEQQDQIDAIQEASDKEIERLDKQITLMTETRDYEKTNGLFWDEISLMMKEWSPEQLVAYIMENTASLKEDSLLSKEEFHKETQSQVESYFGNLGTEDQFNAWNEYFTEVSKEGHKFANVAVKNSSSAMNAFNEAYKTGGKNAAVTAANKVYTEALDKVNKPATGEEEKTEYVEQEASINGAKLYIRDGDGTPLGTVREGKTFTVLAFDPKTKRLKVKGAQTTRNGVQDGYITYDKYKENFIGVDISKLPGFSKGGLVNYTGLAKVHGSKTKPESFISAEHTKLLRSSIFSPHNNVLEQLRELYENYKGASNINNSNDSNIVIENISISVETGAIADSYDARSAGQEIFDEMVRLARKTTNVKLSRR